MAVYRDQGVVLRTHKLAEADRIITLLTRQHGKVRAVAKGVRRTKSRFGARLEPFMHVDLQLYEGRNLDTVTQVETLGGYADAITADYPRYTAAAAIAETADKLTPEEREPALQLFLLTAGAFAALARGAHQPGLVVDSYLLRSLALSGYAPSLGGCAKCGAPGPHRWFSPAAGGMVCGDCRPPGSAAPAEATVALLGALLAGDWAVADAAGEPARHEAAGLVAAFAQWHMERAIRALRHLER
ncbi:MAG: DNA repair protein RecO [Bifidobacteriaceae bacterium]|nr:DNA repair protein RecO [Bifidobacteriaceae bacterium]